MNLKHSREEPFATAGSAALRRPPSGVAVFHQMFWSWAWVSIGVPGFRALRRRRCSSTRPPRPSHGSAGWASRSSLSFPASSSRIPPARLRRVSFCSAAHSGFIRRSGFVPPRASSFCFNLSEVDRRPNSSCPTSTAMLMVPKGVTGQWLDGVYWTLAAETAFYELVYCAMLSEKGHAEAPGLGSHHL